MTLPSGPCESDFMQVQVLLPAPQKDWQFVNPFCIGGEFMIYTIDDLRTIVGSVAQQYGVKKVALFGSYSTGQQTNDSDVDLLIDKGDLKGLFMFNSFVNSLSERLGKNVDVITYPSLERSLIKNSVKNEVVLYEQQR